MDQGPNDDVLAREQKLAFQRLARRVINAALLGPDLATSRALGLAELALGPKTIELAGKNHGQMRGHFTPSHAETRGTFAAGRSLRLRTGEIERAATCAAVSARGRCSLVDVHPQLREPVVAEAAHEQDVPHQPRY
ncbi:hypothetical protein AYI69_g9818 [Smittium culicis]|uniref:Uncharacterized protein n=1 Tax=Smittium culicis TaxID=133412 RepID=A0A1R1XA01_9FUNG|nr:hypothetical protein AYI69_g9818 [Smittium culicis]